MRVIIIALLILTSCQNAPALTRTSEPFSNSPTDCAQAVDVSLTKDVKAGETQQLNFKVQNCGRNKWSQVNLLTKVATKPHGSTLKIPESIALPDVAPGASTTVNLGFIVPVISGTYTVLMQVVDREGIQLGQTFQLDLKLGT